jgi:hypothetical protein
MEEHVVSGIDIGQIVMTILCPFGYQSSGDLGSVRKGLGVRAFQKDIHELLLKRTRDFQGVVVYYGIEPELKEYFHYGCLVLPFEGQNGSNKNSHAGVMLGEKIASLGFHIPFSTSDYALQDMEKMMKQVVDFLFIWEYNSGVLLLRSPVENADATNTKMPFLIDSYGGME